MAKIQRDLAFSCLFLFAQSIMFFDGFSQKSLKNNCLKMKLLSHRQSLFALALAGLSETSRFVSLPYGERSRRIESLLESMDNAKVEHALVSGMLLLEKWPQNEPFMRPLLLFGQNFPRQTRSQQRCLRRFRHR